MSSDHQELETQITDLQIRQTHLDDTVQALNDVIIRQQQMIDDLTLEIESLKQRLRSVADSNIADPSQETPPPHY